MQGNPLTSLEIRGAFRQPLAPIEITNGYRVRLAAVMFGLVLLQILYLLLIGVVGYITWLSTIYALTSGLSLNVITIVIYAGPPVAGLIATLFLLKPLLIRPARAPEPFELKRESEPVLFEFVENVCRSLGSPRPSRIFVDLRVNASASVRGWRGFFLGHVDLTIGLPLAVGLNLPQLTGVLAHEFGHFAQRTGLRSYFLIQTIQNWFARVVHQRDGMDAWLERQIGHRDWRIKIIASIAGFAVTGSRRYLGWLMKAGSWISAAFSRQMEFDADRRELAMVGMDVYEQTSYRILLLTVGANIAWNDLAQDWPLGRLPEDLPQLAVFRTGHLSSEVCEQILTQENNKATGRWDTHPSTPERIASARATGLTGAFFLQGTSGSLFQDLPSLCREATVYHYRSILSLGDRSVRLVPFQEAIANAEAQRDYESAVHALFGANAQFCSRWFRLSADDPRPRDKEEAAEDPQPKFDADAYDSALHTNLLHFAALTIKQCGVAVNPASFRLPGSDLETIRNHEAVTTLNMNLALQHDRGAAIHIARHIESTMAGVLAGDLDLVIPANNLSRIPDPKAAWQSYRALSQLQDEVLEIRRYYFAVQIVRENARLFPAAICANLIDDLESRALSEVDRIITKTAEIPSTVELDPNSAPTVGGQLALTSDSRSERIRMFLSRMDTLAARTLGQLAWLTTVARAATSDRGSTAMP